jgi:hypothetical protein
MTKASNKRDTKGIKSHGRKTNENWISCQNNNENNEESLSEKMTDTEGDSSESIQFKNLWRIKK